MIRHSAPLKATKPIDITPHISAPGPETTTDDIDWIAVERAVNQPDARVELNHAEKRAAALLMTRAGYSERDISTRLCVFMRQVTRWKQDGKPLVLPEKAVRGCDIHGCLNPHRAGGLCCHHYDKARRSQHKQAAA